MPRPTLPPTPGSSSDIKGKDGPQFGSLQMSFELPPPAITGADSRPSSASAKSSSASSYHPTSPKSPPMPVSAPTASARRRSSAAQAAGKDAFSLPPPPTRSRKIIQVKPRAQREEVVEDSVGQTSTGKGAAPSKKKQPSSTSMAGRKIARKTAHSLIERRRRSKMNEEFGVLKSMIPACTGEMHKLAILQASIDYVRYLEDCVAKLKTQNSRSTPTPGTDMDFAQLPTARESYNTSGQQGYEDEEDDDEENADEDVEMAGSEHPSPTSTFTYANPGNQNHQSHHSHQPSTSPYLLAQDSQQQHHRQSQSQESHARNRINSQASNSTDNRHYSFSHSYHGSATASPAFGPQTSSYDYAGSVISGGQLSALTSPALLPQRSSDGEFDETTATAALLMLNADRRGTGSGARSMSVKDLLSA